MIWLSRICILASVLCVIGFFATFFVESSYASKAQLIQRIEYDEASASLLGEAGPPVGSPQQMIITDRDAFIKGAGPEGAKLVDEHYLRDHKIYPLQLQTVRYVSGLARWGFAGGFLLSMLVGWAARRRLGRRPMDEN